MLSVILHGTAELLEPSSSSMSGSESSSTATAGRSTGGAPAAAFGGIVSLILFSAWEGEATLHGSRSGVLYHSMKRESLMVVMLLLARAWMQLG